MRITAIIPTHNRLTTLPRAIKSVCSQNTPVEECIVVDDGSDDGTYDWVRKHHPEVICLQQDNHGVSAARNLAIKHSTGDWLAFLDSDDEWLVNKITVMSAALAQYPEYKLVHSDEIWIRNGVRVNPMNKHQKYGGHIYQHCLPLCCISPSAVMIEKTLFEQVGMFDESLPACEDYDLWLRICCRYPVLYVEQKLINKYGGHSDQLSAKHWGMDRFRIQALENILQSGYLNQVQIDATIETLLDKTRILLQGAVKHNNAELADSCKNTLQRYLHHS